MSFGFKGDTFAFGISWLVLDIDWLIASIFHRPALTPQVFLCLGFVGLVVFVRFG